MHKISKRLALSFLALLMGLITNAQEMMTDKKVEMADGLRSSGKIYVVVAVLVTILLGIIFYLFNLDRKINRLEKEL